MKGMILAAGLGSRLGTLTDERPKPLIPVADIPVIRYAVALLAGAGITDIVINLFHLGALIEQELGDGRDAGVRIAYSREAPAILGTGGGMKQALARGLLAPDEPFVVVNGKIVFDLDLPAVIAEHDRSGALATLVVRPDPDARRWGAINTHAGRVVGILDHRAPDATTSAGVDHMFTGVHVIEPALLARLPDGEACILRQGYIPALLAGVPLGAYVAPGYFHEHSTPARYLEGNLNLLRGQVTLAHPPGALLGVDPSAVTTGADIVPPVRIGPGAHIAAGARIGPDAVIGRNARVGPVRVERAVVWPDAVVDRDAISTIVTPRTRVDVASE